MQTHLRPEYIVSLSIGLIIAMVLNRIAGWWLDSGSGVGATLAAQFVAALLVGVLFSVGPGTIWPLVLIVAGVVTAAPVLAGLAVASMLK